MKRLLITEDDKKYILGLYGLLNESIDPNSGGTITINNYYPAGWYSLENKDTQSGKIIKDQLNEALAQVTEFVKKHPDSIVSVKFISQESAIPNKDNEGKAGGTWLNVGGLSDLRKQYLEPYIKQYFDDLKAQGVIGQTVEVPPLEYEKKDVVTKWVDTPFCPKNATINQQRSECVTKYREGVKKSDPAVLEYKTKYDREQSSQLVITVRLKSEPTKPSSGNTPDYTQCAVELNVRVWVKSHNCQNAEFFIFANDLLLYNSQGGMTANLNNANTTRGIPKTGSEPLFTPEYLNPGYGYLKNGDGTGAYSYGTIDETGNDGGSRSDTFKITKEQSLALMNKSNGKISLWMIATTSSAHKDIPNVTITKTDGTVIYNKAPKIVQGKLLTLDGCTYKVIEGTDETVPDVTGYVNLIRQERIKMQSQAELGGEAQKGNKRQQNKKKVILDSKALILDRVTDLVTEMTNFLNNLKPSLEKAQPVDKSGIATGINVGTPEIQAEITNKYKSFYEKLTYSGTPESPVPQLLRDDVGNYINPTVNNDKLFGDIRMYMDQFYEGFDAVYKNENDEISPNGIQRKNRGGLNGNKILSNIKRLTQYTI
jgi:hypothetical protein